MNEIINKIDKSKTKTIDLEIYYPKKSQMILDISKWLFEGMLLKEKDFRNALENHDWQKYKNSYVALFCSTEAIVPSWAYLLVSCYLSGVAKNIILGNLKDLRSFIFKELIEKMDFSEFKNEIVVLKGCSEKPIPENAYIFLIEKLKPFARKILYGEMCSAVPLYKK